MFFAVCPVGTFGDGCQELCECVGGETCDPVTGKCDCGEGRKGFHCEEGKHINIRAWFWLIFMISQQAVITRIHSGCKKAEFI